MELGAKEVGIVIALLLGALGLGARKVWSFKWSADETIKALTDGHERERAQWQAQMEELRATCRDGRERERQLWAIAFERRDLIVKAVDVAVQAKS